MSLDINKFEELAVGIERKRVEQINKKVASINKIAMEKMRRFFNMLSPDDQMEVRRRQQSAIAEIQSKIVRPSSPSIMEKIKKSLTSH